MADSLRPLAEAKGLALCVQVPAGLTLNGDMDALIRLFVNLLDNAIKYIERGEITLAVRSEVDELIVEVTDTGIGIPVCQRNPYFLGCWLRSFAQAPRHLARLLPSRRTQA